MHRVFRRILNIFGESTGVVTNLQANTTVLKNFSSVSPTHTPATVAEETHRTTLKPLPEKKILHSKGTLTTDTDKNQTNQVSSGFADLMFSHP